MEMLMSADVYLKNSRHGYGATGFLLHVQAPKWQTLHYVTFALIFHPTKHPRHEIR